MNTPNEFWLALHTLAEAYSDEGRSAEERADNIMDVYQKMPPTVRRQLLGDLRRLAEILPDLLVIVRGGEARQADSQKPIRHSG